MKINGIEIINTAQAHAAIIVAVADECLSRHGIRSTEQNEDGDIWDGPLLLPYSVNIYHATFATGVAYSVTLADGRNEHHNLSTNQCDELKHLGFIS